MSNCVCIASNSSEITVTTVRWACGVIIVVQEYRLMYRVFDDKFANTTTVIIQVLDVNDNAPRFDNAIYNVTDVQEEEPGISKNNHKYLLTVRLSLSLERLHN